MNLFKTNKPNDWIHHNRLMNEVDGNIFDVMTDAMVDKPEAFAPNERTPVNTIRLTELRGAPEEGSLVFYEDDGGYVYPCVFSCTFLNSVYVRRVNGFWDGGFKTTIVSMYSVFVIPSMSIEDCKPNPVCKTAGGVEYHVGDNILFHRGPTYTQIGTIVSIGHEYIVIHWDDEPWNIIDTHQLKTVNGDPRFMKVIR